MLKPGEIPQYTGNLDQLEIDHADLKKDAANVRATGGDVHSRFQGLSAYYTAPEAEQLFATTKPVKDRADAFADDLETVSSALSSYATEIRPLVDKLEQLKTQATTFVSSVKDDDEWEYDGDKVEEHNQLRDEITATVAAFWAAERTAHNKITALWGGTQMVAGDGSDRKDQYGFAADDMKNAKVPWGDPVEEKHHWYEVGHWVKSFVWDGLIVDGVWGTIKGLGTLVGFGGWDAMGQAWKGLAQLATGLTISMMPGAQVAFWGLPDDKLPAWLRDSRTAMKETGKALLAWDEWGKNPARAAGAVTFNVLTTVFTGGAGAGVSGAGKAGAAAKVLSAAGKTARVIDPMTYIAKGTGAGLSKIGDISAALKGVGNIDIPALPDNAITLPEGAVKLPDGTVNLPEGAAIPDGATRLPDGNVQLPHDTPVLPEGTTKLPSVDGSPAHYMDGDGNLLDQHGNVIDNIDNAPTDVVDKPASGNPAAGADVPRVDSPAKEPALVGAGAHTAEQAGRHVRLGSDLGDVGRVPDNAAVRAGGGSVPAVHAGGGGVPGGHAGDHLPGGNAAGHFPGGTADHLPSGRADELSGGPSASHEPPSGPRDPSPSHADDGTTPNSHADDGVHHGGSNEPAGGSADEGASQGGHTDEAAHHHGDGGDGPPPPHGNDAVPPPRGNPVDPQPGWHGQSADQMRHYRRPAIDVSHLPPEQQLAVLESEAKALADDANNAPAGAAPAGKNRLESGCAGTFLHDNVITVHTSTTKMHGQKLPNTHQALKDILKDISDQAAANGTKMGLGHGKCAEVSLISDRLHQLDPTGTAIRNVDDARAALEGGVMHSRQIGDVIDRETGQVISPHNDFLPPCNTCRQVLPQLGIRVHS
ncbi:YwqJ-related putative deaminase [Streptomyces sp. A30]|uniref:YwqJ-related putative deaminase n=1 Tax=Streptomyces sp. A30 TaxID=2789273 RepID=UPI00398093B2